MDDKGQSDQVTYQTYAGMIWMCCTPMRYAVNSGYIRRGYLYRKHNPPRWISWSFHIDFPGGVERGPIRYCPWCGADLDAPEG